MAEKDEFFSPDEVDKQIESISQFKEGDRVDAEAMAYLRSFYQADTQQEQDALNRVWNRIAGATFFEQDTQESKKVQPMQNPQMPYTAGAMGSGRGSHPRRSSLMQRFSILAAAGFLVALIGSMAFVFYAVRHNGSLGSPNPTAGISTTRVPLKVTSVTMSVTPGSIAGLS